MYQLENETSQQLFLLIRILPGQSYDGQVSTPRNPVEPRRPVFSQAAKIGFAVNVLPEVSDETI
jgi:hypothetical protein